MLAHFGVSQGVRNIGFEPRESRSERHTLDNYPTLFGGVGGEARFRGFFIGVNFDYLMPREATVGNMPVFTIATGGRIAGRADEEQPTSRAADDRDERPIEKLSSPTRQPTRRR